MDIKEIYKRWAVDYANARYRDQIKVSDIANVEFYHSVGGGSPSIDDPDFSTFAGCEVWSVGIDMKDGSYDSISLYDSNPAGMIADYIKKNNLTVEFPPDEEPTLEDQIDSHIR